MPDEWVRYFRDDGRPLEAMHAHFQHHTYHRHAHETYSFGVTEAGAQSFTCRGGAHTSAAGMVMMFNPDDPHDGSSATPGGFTYRMVHIGPSLIQDVLGERPLFARPVLADPVLAEAVGRLHAVLTEPASLGRDEVLFSTLATIVRRGATRPRRAVPSPAVSALPSAPAQRDLAEQTRALLAERFTETLSADDLASALDASRFAIYRAFSARFGMSPSDYQRLLRARAARDLFRAGRTPAEVAGLVGFADQAHLTRWFVRYFGVTPAAYRRAV
jgi:AraC-like DNA-binding protein